MRKAVVTEGQDLYDVAVQEYGHPGGILLLARMNGLPLQASLSAGQELAVDTAGVINAQAVAYYASRGLRVNTFFVPQPQQEYQEDHDLNHDLSHA